MVFLAVLAAILAAASPPASVVSPLPLLELPTQTLAPGACALVLWERATGRRVAMMVLQPDGIRVHTGDGVKTLNRTTADGDVVAGFAPHARYGDESMRIETSLVIVGNDVAGSAIIRDGIIAVTGADGEEVIAPVAGIAGCSP